MMPDSTDAKWRPHRASILGVGLLGASVGMAMRRAWPDLAVIGYGRSELALQTALEVGAVTETCCDLQEACTNADLVIVGTPVDVIAEHALAAAQVCAAGAMITDVGSTKASIVAALADDPKARAHFIGAHPIAGGEKSGAGHARGDLFHDRLVVITPLDSTPKHLCLRAQQLWEQLGATTIFTTPADHDRWLAATSHLPHLLAAALTLNLSPEAQPFIGPGWRGTTRIAGGSPEMWTAICLDNSAAILEQIDRFSQTLGKLRASIAANDAAAIHDFFNSAKEFRAKLESPDAPPRPPTGG